MVVLGMMINLSNRVRRESADHETRRMLSELYVMMAQYQQEYGKLPPVTPLVQPAVGAQQVNEADLQVAARQNNADFFRYLRLGALANGKGNGNDRGNDRGNDPVATAIRQSGSDLPVLEDPWGTPIVFMQNPHPAISLVPGDVFFFVSAGPDRQFLTHDDNLYSYDEIIK